MGAFYLDSSAIVKLVVKEPESLSLRRYLRRKHPVVSSALSLTEVVRAVAFEGPEAIARAVKVLRTLDLIRVNKTVLEAAGSIQPTSVRSLDAIHLATARSLERDLSRLVTYDDRMAEAAEAIGLACAAPE